MFCIGICDQDFTRSSPTAVELKVTSEGGIFAQLLVIGKLVSFTTPRSLAVLRLNAKIALLVLLDYVLSRVECKYGGLIRGGIVPRQSDTSLLSCLLDRRVRPQRNTSFQVSLGSKSNIEVSALNQPIDKESCS